VLFYNLAEGAITQQQENLSVLTETINTETNQTLGGVQTNGSFHSASSGDSAAEMSTYFPDAQTSNVTSFR